MDLNITQYEIDLNCVPFIEEHGNENLAYEFDLNSVLYNEDRVHEFDLNFDPYEEEDDDMSVENQSEGGEEDNVFEMEYDIFSDDEFSDDEQGIGLIVTRKEAKFLDNSDRNAIYRMLQNHVCPNGRLKKGITKALATCYQVSRCTIQRIWDMGNTNQIKDASHRKGNCGRKRSPMDVVSHIRNTPLRKRTSFRSLSSEVGIPKSTLHRLFKLGILRRHSNPVKPFLMDENFLSRLLFCLSMLEESSPPHDPLFKDMYNTIHIVEKGFMMSKKAEKYYLTQEEENPHRTCKSKNFITKVMFLVVIARPRFDSSGNVIFDGKIGVFPFVTKEPAKRRSVNRAAGTLETKAMTSVKRTDVKAFLIKKVLPAIRQKWPREDSGYPIFIQQDNARTHIDPFDNDFQIAATQDGFDIRLIFQPVNSPDLNVLDLGFFSAIQSLMHKEAPSSIDELLYAMQKSYAEFLPVKSNYIFLTLQLTMMKIMNDKGNNQYKSPHINKAMLDRQGILPRQIRIDPALVQEVLQYLN